MSASALHQSNTSSKQISCLVAEKAFLGALIRAPHDFSLVRDAVRAEHFSEEVHQEIFTVIADVLMSGQKLSMTLLASRLPEEFGDGRSMGPYLAVLTHNADGLSAVDFADLVVEAASRRAVPTPTAGSKFAPIAIDDVELSTEPAWAIDRLLPARGLSSTYGPPKCRKSFLMCDALFAVARGVPYAGRTVLQGSVFYCTGEGVSGFKRRLVAMRQHYEVEGQRVPFFMIPNVPDLGSERTDVRDLLAQIDQCLKERSLPPPRAIALDTVARCMGDGDENTARDMGRFVTRCGEIERRYGCLVAAVHHTGKDPTLGGRGSNALNGAADVTWKVESNDGFSRVTIEEIKDGPSDVSWTFRLLPFDIRATKSATIKNGADLPEIGSELETCVVELLTEPDSATKYATKPKRRLAGLAGDLFKIVTAAIGEAGVLDHGVTAAPSGARAVTKETLKAYCTTMAWQDPEGNQHSFRTMLAKYLSGLRAQDLIGFDRNWIWLT